MKQEKLLLLPFAAGLLNAEAAPQKGDGDNRPNVIIIYADDLGYGDLECYGAKNVETPNVNRLANEGIRLTNTHAVAATSTPSRYSLLTGEYAWRRPGTDIAAGNAAMAVELALALCRKEVDISDEAILDGIAAVDNRCSIRVLSQRPLVILDACRTPQQAAALLRVLNMAKVRHMSAIIGLTEEEGAEAFFSALETGLSPEEQKKDKSTMPGMSESPFDKVYLVTPAGVEEQLTRRLTEKAKYHFDAQLCTSLDEAVQLAHANTRRGLLVCGSEAAALEAAALLAKA